MGLLAKLKEKKALRVIDVEQESGQKNKDVLYNDIDSYIMLVEEGEEHFIILSSLDGFLQFYGVNNQFVCEVRINLPNNDFRTFSIINKNKEHLVERIQLTTPYGSFTPRECEVVSLELLRTVVREYYENTNAEEFLKNIPCMETTEETKRCMGLIK